MTWQQLQNSSRAQPLPTSRQEIDSLRAVVDRDLKDAAVAELSSDRRFAIAYNAILQLAQIVVRSAGYRITARAGHHQTTLEAVKLALGSSVNTTVDYFDTCRRKRNRLDYDRTQVATETETEELLEEAKKFGLLVEEWIRQNYPQFAV